MMMPNMVTLLNLDESPSGMPHDFVLQPLGAHPSGKVVIEGLPFVLLVGEQEWHMLTHSNDNDSVLRKLQSLAYLPTFGLSPHISEEVRLQRRVREPTSIQLKLVDPFGVKVCQQINISLTSTCWSCPSNLYIDIPSSLAVIELDAGRLGKTRGIMWSSSTQASGLLPEAHLECMITTHTGAGFLLVFDWHLNTHKLSQVILTTNCSSMESIRTEEDNYRFNVRTQPFCQSLLYKSSDIPMFGRGSEGAMSNTSQPESPAWLHAVEATKPFINSKTNSSNFSATTIKQQSKRDNKMLQSVKTNPALFKQYATERSTCMVLQEALKRIDENVEGKLVGELLESSMVHFNSIACNTYGNFLMQILISKLNCFQRIVLLRKSRNTFAQLSSDARGIFCVQKLLEVIDSEEEQELFLQCLLNQLRNLIKNPEARFVFKKAIQTFKKEYSLRLLESLIPNFLETACDKYGICVLKFLIKQYESDVTIIKLIASKFLKHVSKGKANSHFNFGIHHLLEVVNRQGWIIEDVETIIRYFFMRETRSRIRSRAVAQTVIMAKGYFHTPLVDEIVIPNICRLFNNPLTEQEEELLASVEVSNPELRPNIKHIRELLAAGDQQLSSPHSNSLKSLD